MKAGNQCWLGNFVQMQWIRNRLVIASLVLSMPPFTGSLLAAGGDGSSGFVLEGVDILENSGNSVSKLGDINGDGMDDFIIGAPYADPNGIANAGRVYVVFGSRTGFPPTFRLSSLLPAYGGDGSKGFVINGAFESDKAGFVSIAGDINGDGIGDICINAASADANGKSNVGVSYVIYGRASSFPATFELRSLFSATGGDGSNGFVIKGVAKDDYTSRAHAAGDVNGDGIGDLILGAYSADSNGMANNGRSYIVFGRVTGFSAEFELSSLFAAAGGDGSSGFVLMGVDSGDGAGDAVSGAGDVNSDGIDDIIIGAYQADPNGMSEAGESYVVYGRTTGFPAEFQLSSLFPAAGGDGSQGFVLKGVHVYDHSGSPVAGAGDINADGIDDLVIGASTAYTSAGGLTGVIYVVFGRNIGFPALFELTSLYPAAGGDGSSGFVIKGINRADRAGVSVSTSGDMNGDGINDLVVSAYLADSGGKLDTGETYVVFGRAVAYPALIELGNLLPGAGGDGSQGFVLQGIDPRDYSGISVSYAGDVNGDGFDDIIIGAYDADPNDIESAGESYVVFGRATGFPAAFELGSLFP